MDYLIQILVAMIPSLITLIGVLTSNSKHIHSITELLNYRMDIIEKKQDKYNNVLERIQTIETSLTVLDERQKVANHRIDDLESKVS